ncbi:MAG: class F sortase, partial [Chloroflexi bacterium]|nr:class F sortase [Chloroflexota bacterium]
SDEARAAGRGTAGDSSDFRPPPARASAPPTTNGGIERVVAPALQINHYVEVVGIANNQMQTPRDGTYAIGWYDDYDRPGSGGNVIVSAHETWNHMQGPFYGLHRAAAGDEIAIEMIDGTRYRYVVFSNVRYSVNDIPMREVIWPSTRPPGQEWLTLITCGGRIVYNSRGFGEYLDRDVVIARRVN